MIIVLTGSSSFALHDALKRLVADFVAEHGDLAVEKHDGEDLNKEQIQGALQTLPFLARKKLVVIRELSKNKVLIEEPEQLLSAVPDTTDLILYEPKLDKRSSYFKQLKKLPGFKEFTELDVNQLSCWLVAQAKAAGGALSSSDARYLIDRIGPNQLMLGNELDKLLMYSPKVTREVIDLLSEPTPQSTVFQVLEAAFSGNRHKAIELYRDQRRQRIEPMAILAMLVWQLHIVAIAKTAGQRSESEIAKEAKLNPFVVRKSMGIARQLSLEHIKRLISEVADLEMRLKSEPIDADEALENFLLELTSND